jgi:ribosomal-protein-alanine N-acetyltransferase
VSAIDAARTIATERLLLRPITRDDAIVTLGGGTPDGLTYAAGYPNETALDALGRLVNSEGEGPTSFNIIRREQCDVIGGIGYWLPAGWNRPSVGYDIAEPLWCQGYATEALKGLLDHLLTQPGIEAVEADTEESHIASRRVMEKAGMKHIGTRRLEDDGVTLVFYEIRRP